METYILYLEDGTKETVTGIDIVEAIKNAGYNNISTFSVGKKKQYKFKKGEWMSKKRSLKFSVLSNIPFKQRISVHWWHYKQWFKPVNIYHRVLHWYHVRFEEHTMEPIPKYGDVYSMEDFKENCDCGGFINYDGFAHPIVNSMMDEDVMIKPSQVKKGKYVKKYESVVWFNR